MSISGIWVLNYNRVLYSPNYKIIGTSATLTINGVVYPNIDKPNRIRVIDNTAGAAIRQGRVEIETEIPSIFIRTSTLNYLGITAENLVEAVISFNNGTWKIKDFKPMPSPKGEGDGEVFCIIEDMA